jgi:phage-related protein
MGGKAKEGASSFVSNVQEGLSGISDKVKSVGTHLVEGIWEGMSSSMDWIKGKINGWVDDVLDYLKKVFKIGSPSKLMADEVGHWLPLGMASGFDASMPEAEKEMQTSINNAVRGLKADVSVSSGNIKAVAGASGVNLGGTNQEVNFYQTINSPKAVDRLSIYRDTNELLFTSKVRLSNV